VPPPAAKPVAADAAAASVPAPAAAGVASPPPVMPFDEAITFAATQLFSKAQLPAGAAKLQLVIDPLIDANTGAQSHATQTMQQRITDLLKASFPRFDLQPFSSASLARSPLLLIGTLTPVDKDNRNGPGPREWYRIWLTLVDLQTGKIVSKGFARARPDGVDPTPTAFFQDSPAWAPDAVIDGYVRTCQGSNIGDPIDPAYFEKLVSAALVNEAVSNYNDGRYDEALVLYRGIARTGGADQLRVYNGIYLANLKLGRKDEAARAFSDIVDYGLAQKRLAVKFLFRPGTSLFVRDPEVSGAYPSWLQQIAARTRQRQACMEVSGHTSRTGPAPLNDRLSLMRAQYVTQRLDAGAPGVSRRTTAVGRGSREPISGLGTDDARDSLDRRVEFKVIDCPV
jgi:outer membrane protein OmpA-like peptidoglycan-associated protein